MKINTSLSLPRTSKLMRRKNIMSAVEYYKGLKNKVLGMRTKKNEEDRE